MFLCSDKFGVVDESLTMICFYRWGVKLQQPIAFKNVSDLLSAIQIYVEPVKKTKDKEPVEALVTIEEEPDCLVIQDSKGKYRTRIKSTDKKNIEKFVREDEEKYLVDVKDDFVLIDADTVKKLTSNISLLKLDGDDDRITIEDGKMRLRSKDKTTSNSFEVTIDGLDRFPSMMVGSKDFRRIYDKRDYEMRAFWGGIYLKSTKGDLTYFLSLYSKK